jgi:hypothetical protein
VGDGDGDQISRKGGADNIDEQFTVVNYDFALLYYPKVVWIVLVLEPQGGRDKPKSYQLRRRDFLLDPADRRI